MLSKSLRHHCNGIYGEIDIFSSCLRRTAASLSEEKLSLSHVAMVTACRSAAWSVYTFALASPTMTHQPIEEGGENEDFFDFARRPLN